MKKKLSVLVFIGCLACTLAVVAKCCKSILDSIYDIETSVLTKNVYRRYSEGGKQ